MTHDTEPTFDCTDITALLSALIDGVLDQAQRHAAERHLASCAACRQLLSEAERNDALVAAAGAASGAGLPEGFEQEVLDRTAHPETAAARFRSWLGWIAAAASLMLAASLLVLERAAVRRAPAPPIQSVSYAPGPELRSTIRTVDPAQTRAAPAASSAEPVGATRSLPRDAAETFQSASMLLAMLQRGDDESFADVELVRRIAEYEELLPRMARAREVLPAAERQAVWAAESMLFRVVRGPLSLEDIREMRRDAARLDLQQRLEALGAGAPAESSL